MQIIDQLVPLRQCLKTIRESGGTVALVPTMGALHAGHMALVDLAKQHADHVVVSIFVNPKQFGAGEDLARYPKRAEEDAAMLRAAGVAVLWMPTVDVMYPPGYATNISVSSLGDGLCGAARPGHFDGVATVVAKLFTQIAPDCAIFGEKDWQQLAIIRRMVIDLNLDLTIIGAPIVRDADGLALSSRNIYLSERERTAALSLPAALIEASRVIESGCSIESALSAAKQAILAGGFAAIDYVELVAADTLVPLTVLDQDARILAAARIGSTRLIDNFAVHPKKLPRR